MPARLPRAAAAAAVAVAAVALYFVVLGPAPPPGFIRDEASIAYNAHTLSQNLRDQNGGLLPLYCGSGRRGSRSPALRCWSARSSYSSTTTT